MSGLNPPPVWCKDSVSKLFAQIDQDTQNNHLHRLYQRGSWFRTRVSSLETRFSFSPKVLRLPVPALRFSLLQSCSYHRTTCGCKEHMAAGLNTNHNKGCCKTVSRNRSGKQHFPCAHKICLSELWFFITGTCPKLIPSTSIFTVWSPGSSKKTCRFLPPSTQSENILIKFSQSQFSVLQSGKGPDFRWPVPSFNTSVEKKSGRGQATLRPPFQQHKTITDEKIMARGDELKFIPYSSVFHQFAGYPWKNTKLEIFLFKANQWMKSLWVKSSPR